MILTKDNHAQEKVFKELDLEIFLDKMMFEMLNPILLILIDLITLVD